MTAEDIAEAYVILGRAREKHTNDSLTVVVLSQDLENKKIELMLSGSINGSNAAVRDAQMQKLLEEHQSALAEAQFAERCSRLPLELAQDKVDCLKLQMRLLEYGQR